MVREHQFDREIDNAYVSRADREAPATDAALNNMRENVPTLKNLYNKSGKPQMWAQSKMTYASDGISEALTFIDDNMKTSHMTFFKSSFASYRTLAHNCFTN